MDYTSCILWLIFAGCHGIVLLGSLLAKNFLAKASAGFLGGAIVAAAAAACGAPLGLQFFLYVGVFTAVVLLLFPYLEKRKQKNIETTNERSQNNA